MFIHLWNKDAPFHWWHFITSSIFFLSFFLGGIQNDVVLDLINTVFHLLSHHILGRSMVSLYTVQLVFYISASLSLGETISTHLCLLKEHVHYSLLPGWLLHVFLYWGQEGAWGSPFCVAFREFPYKEERIILFCRGAEGQVMVGRVGAGA